MNLSGIRSTARRMCSCADRPGRTVGQADQHELHALDGLAAVGRDGFPG